MDGTGMGSGPRTNAAFDTACETIRSLLAQAARDEIQTRYRIGTLLRTVSGAVETYGDRAVERVAKRLDVSADTLYRCIIVAEAWTIEQLGALTGRTNRRGEPLSWSHLVTLAKVTPEAARRRWVERCLEGAWTTRVLAQYIAADGQGLSAASGPGNAIQVALAEGVQNASRARAHIRIVLEALQARLQDDLDLDDELVGRAIRAHEELRAEVDATILCLRESRQASGTRVRVAVSAPVDVDELSERRARQR